ncbi:hypothetical protein P3T37_004843 [Kitasatospora sp. MAA4]|nr:hypothetical protein [Kitasatospora sp. MAA4]
MPKGDIEVWQLSELLGDDYSRPAERELCLRLIRDLLSEGAQAGDLSADPDHPFVPWESTAAGSLVRIRAKLEALGSRPIPGTSAGSRRTDRPPASRGRCRTGDMPNGRAVLLDAPRRWHGSVGLVAKCCVR